jgi:hypothetical protein
MTELQQAFKEFMDGLIARYRHANKLAQALDVTTTTVSRAANQTFTLSLENCLKLAETVNEPPSKVLTLAGKSEEAALIERLYGGARPYLSPTDRQLLALSPDAKRKLLTFVRELAPETPTDQQQPAEQPKRADQQKGKTKKTA